MYDIDIEAARHRLHAKRERAPSDETLAAAIDALQRQLDGMISAMDSLDTRAAIVPPIITGLGALTFFGGGSLGPVWQLGAALLAVAFVAGSLAFVFAYLSIRAKDFSYGADPEQLALKTSLDPISYAQQHANSMVEVVLRAAAALDRKAMWFNLSLVAAGLSVIALLGFRFFASLGAPPA